MEYKDDISFKQIQELADESGYVHVAMREFNKKNNVDWTLSELQPSTLSAILIRAQEIKRAAKGQCTFCGGDKNHVHN
jgi:hypothetical protein